MQQARRDDGPVTGRGAQTKQALLAAARRVFERKGFVESRVSDIVREAKVSHGTFYTYFDTKEAIFKAVSLAVVETMLADMTADLSVAGPSPDFHDRVRDSVRRYVRAYRPHATIIGLMEQVGTFSPEMRQLRLDVRAAFVRRTERGIARMQAAGHADPDLDVEYTAESLGAMLEHITYLWFSLNHPFDEQRIIDTLSGIWERTLSPGHVAADSDGMVPVRPAEAEADRGCGS
jgi:AcrR family transcriptional regulator